MKKIFFVVLCVALLFVPTYVALGSYYMAQNSPVDEDAVTKMIVNAPDGTSYVFDKNSGNSSDTEKAKEMITMFVGINENATKQSSLPDAVKSKAFFEVKYYSYDFETVYKYYFNAEPSEAYYVDNNDVAYKIAQPDAADFVYSPYAISLYTSAASPNLSVAGTGVLPQNIQWKYLLSNNDYAQAIVPTTTDLQSVTITSDLRLDFDIEPDYLQVQIYNGSNELFNDLYTNISKVTFTENATLSVIVQARWYEDATRASYGEAQYNFNINIVAPPVFSLGSSSIEHGEFVVITGRNVLDASTISFSSSPDIGFTPVFFAEGTAVHALVPISYAVDYSSNFTFNIECEGTVSVLNLAVESKTFRAQNYNVSIELISQYFDGNANAAFADTMAPYFANRLDGAYFGGALGYPAASISSLSGTVKTGYGIYRTLSVTGTTYRHDGVDFMVGSGDVVTAAYGGKVIFSGQTAKSGRTVVIDHGWGLKTLYAHMSNIYVEEGAIVNKGDELGIVGSTGFTPDIQLHFGMYVFDVPVSPYNYFDYGIPVS